MVNVANRNKHPRIIVEKYGMVRCQPVRFQEMVTQTVFFVLH